MEKERYLYGTELEPIPTSMEFQFTDLNKIKSVELIGYLTDNPNDERATVKLLSIHDVVRCKTDGYISSMAPFDNSIRYSIEDSILVDLSKFRPLRTRVNIIKNKDWRIQLIMMMDED